MRPGAGVEEPVAGVVPGAPAHAAVLAEQGRDAGHLVSRDNVVDDVLGEQCGELAERGMPGGKVGPLLGHGHREVGAVVRRGELEGDVHEGALLPERQLGGALVAAEAPADEGEVHACSTIASPQPSRNPSWYRAEE